MFCMKCGYQTPKYWIDKPLIGYYEFMIHEQRRLLYQHFMIHHGYPLDKFIHEN